MEGIGRIQAIRTEQLLLLFEKHPSEFREQRICGVQLGGTGETAPRRLQTDLRFGKLILHLAGHISRETLLDGRHTQFTLAIDNFLAQNDVLVNP